ncbi:hypothetical protein HDV00_011017 [Rhizophlyctis rosea]|nr:hypothetical protein HDV00_011017 [Rhizophlyctis rosea]
MGESRTELLAWLNDLLQLGYTKIEQCGTGAAHCQIMDSIYRDVPLSKVKFNAKHEYEYVANFKILQTVFDKHKIDNAIPVERLCKCKFQDNLEFMQWMKKFWDQYYPGGPYDAIGRRKDSPAAPSGIATHKGGLARAAPPPQATSTLKKPAASKPLRTHTSNTSGGGGGGGANWDRERQELENEYQKMLQDVTQQTMELKVGMEQVEKEREFYFNKLREIEVYVQSSLETGTNPAVEQVLKDVQSIMYKTEDGFEIPDGAEGGEEGIEDTY